MKKIEEIKKRLDIVNNSNPDDWSKIADSQADVATLINFFEEKNDQIFKLYEILCNIIDDTAEFVLHLQNTKLYYVQYQLKNEAPKLVFPEIFNTVYSKNEMEKMKKETSRYKILSIVELNGKIIL